MILQLGHLGVKAGLANIGNMLIRYEYANLELAYIPELWMICIPLKLKHSIAYGYSKHMFYLLCILFGEYQLWGPACYLSESAYSCRMATFLTLWAHLTSSYALPNSPEGFLVPDHRFLQAVSCTCRICWPVSVLGVYVIKRNEFHLRPEQGYRHN